MDHWWLQYCWSTTRGRLQSRPVVITIFTQIVRPSVPKFQNQQASTAGRVCRLAEWIIDDSCLVLYCFQIIIMNAMQGDLICEQTFVDVLQMKCIRDHVLVLLNNQPGDFRTRISVYNLRNQEKTFEEEKLEFQYQHNYWKLPVCFDNSSVVHTTEEKSDLVVREFDSFFHQFRWDKKDSLLPIQRRGIYESTLCQRLRRILFKKLCAKCTIMWYDKPIIMLLLM